MSRHESYRRELLVLCSNNIVHPKHRNPAPPLFLCNPPKNQHKRSRISPGLCQISGRCYSGSPGSSSGTGLSTHLDRFPWVDTSLINVPPSLPLISASQVSCRPGYFYYRFNLRLDTLSGFLEESRLFERAITEMRFKPPSLRSS